MRDPFERPEEPRPGDRYIRVSESSSLVRVYKVYEIREQHDQEGHELTGHYIAATDNRAEARELALWPEAEAALREVVASYEWLLEENDEPEDFAQEVWHIINKSHPDGAGPIRGLLDLLDGE